MWYTSIKLTSQGQINFGISNFPFSKDKNLSSKYIYYNNCKGLIVVNK